MLANNANIKLSVRKSNLILTRYLELTTLERGDLPVRCVTVVSPEPEVSFVAFWV